MRMNELIKIILAIPNNLCVSFKFGMTFTFFFVFTLLQIGINPDKPSSIAKGPDLKLTNWFQGIVETVLMIVVSLQG